MSGGGHAPPPIPSSNGGEFLLSLLQKSQHTQNHNQNQNHYRQSLPSDPAVAAVGPSLPFPWGSTPLAPSNGHDLPSAGGGGGFLGFPHSYFHHNQNLGFSNPNSNDSTRLVDQRLKFGSFPSDIAVVSDRKPTPTSSAPPPGFPARPARGPVSEPEWNRRNGLAMATNHNVEREMEFLSRGNPTGLASQLDRPGVPPGSSLPSVSASDFEDSMAKLETEDISRRLVDSLLIEDESEEKSEKKQHTNSRDKDFRSDSRGRWMLSQRRRIEKRGLRCRSDIDRLNEAFGAIVNSLIPPEEVKAKQQQLLVLLERLIVKEWPKARLYLYGSCANSFGVAKSDVDLCLAMEDPDINKVDVLLKLADILESGNLQNVQALTRARVPIVKLLDPVTEISCDICINNVLAVVNTRLLRDYARLDVRLRQLAYIVKHWAKSRGVNETYQGTLSSYAYVLMCIHFLQLRRPAILPCLQGMEATYCVSVDNVECAYFDQVDQLRNFGSRNKESISQLVWGFFNYWAFVHDYTDSVISVRMGSTISKRDKDWTRRVGNDRHLICIEDPFEISHDLGRVVDKHSIRVLREEFERAAEIMQYDPNPCVKLFERYIPI